MAEQDRLSQWAKIARIAVPIIAFVTLSVGSGFLYRELWNVSDLRYTVLPTYELEDLAFSGLVVENRGRVPARDVAIILADLEHDIELLHMPGPHEKADTTWNPESPTNEARIEMERLSPGSSLPIYLLTGGRVTLADGRTLGISADRGKGRPSSQLESLWPAYFILAASVLVTWSYLYGLTRKRQPEIVQHTKTPR